MARGVNHGIPWMSIGNDDKKQSLDVNLMLEYIAGMKVKEALEHFGTEYKIAKALQIHQSAVSRWNKNLIPMKRAWQLHTLSMGKVPFDPSRYANK